MIGKSDTQAICDKALERTGADQAEVTLYNKSSALTRFAKNAVHQNVAEDDTLVYLRVLSGKRVGSASTNRLDDNSLQAAADGARQAAELGPENPNQPDLPVAERIPTVESLDPAAIEHPPEQRADAVREACQAAAQAGVEAYGAYLVEASETAQANTTGLFAYHAGSKADFQTVVRRNGSSGWAHASSWKVDRVPTGALAEEALKKAVDGADPQVIKPETLPVVLDPYATVDLLYMLSVPGMNGRAVAEGRSWMASRIGEQAMSELVSIWDDGLDPDGLPMPFDSEGTMKRRVEIVTEGTVRNPVHDRKTAQLVGADSTGHALPYDVPPMARRFAPLPMNLFMTPGDHSTEELIGSTKRGLYITRFWYTRLVHPGDCVVTGMTRDGVFLIEDGKLARPVKDLRFTQSYVEALRDVEAVGSEVRLSVEDWIGSAVRAPALKISSFRFTGSTV
jgi:predicted Zn-dependent protease